MALTKDIEFNGTGIILGFHTVNTSQENYKLGKVQFTVVGFVDASAETNNKKGLGEGQFTCPFDKSLPTIPQLYAWLRDPANKTIFADAE